MNFQELILPGVFLANSPGLADERGTFREWFKAEEFRAYSGREFFPMQANVSISKLNTLRGIHYSLSPLGQAKWVTCLAGRILDVILDLRMSSPNFGESVSLELHGMSNNSIFIPEGFGHAFLALEENSTICYLQSSKYSMEEEYEINPLDPELKIDWPTVSYLLSDKDLNAPTLFARKKSQELPW